MRRILATLLLFILAVVPVAAQVTKDKETQEKYKNVILLSRKVKEYEKRTWGVEPGRFATKLPQGTARSYAWFVAQDRLKLVHNYTEASCFVVEEYSDFTLLMSTPKMLRKIKNSDILLRSAITSDMEEISEDLANKDLSGQILSILHEDFHNYNGHDLSNRLRTIEEGFCTAFAHFAGSSVAVDIFGDAESTELIDMLDYTDTRDFFRQVNNCYTELDTLYRSRLSRREKLELRKPILQRCGQKIGVLDFNNAFLTDMATYSFYYFYAWEKLEQFGIERFLTAYLKTAVSNKTATKNKGVIWLKYPIKKFGSGVRKFFGTDARTKQEKLESTWLKKFETNLKTAQ